MCKWGNTFDGTTCVPDAAVLLTAGNSTEDLAFFRQQENAAVFNVFTFAAWGAGLVTALTAAGTFAYRKATHKQDETADMYLSLE